MLTAHDVEIILRPLDHSTWFDDGATEYRRSQFRVGFNRTIAGLKRELAHLAADSAVLETDHPPGSIRLDGMPRATAKADTPRVRLTFEAPELGKLSYMCATFKTWQENARAIGLTLERLRLIENYGATRGRQQYRGFAALPPGGESMTTKTAAAIYIAGAAYGQFTGEASAAAVEALERRPGSADAKHLVREAARNTHPDKGGTADAFHKFQQARKALNL